MANVFGVDIYKTPLKGNSASLGSAYRAEYALLLSRGFSSSFSSFVKSRQDEFLQVAAFDTLAHQEFQCQMRAFNKMQAKVCNIGHY